MLYDRQPQPRAPCFFGTGFVHAVKTFQHAALVLGRDADSGIRHLWEAVFLLEVSIELFIDLANRAQKAGVPLEKRIYIFFDELCEEGWLSWGMAPDRDGCRRFMISVDSETRYYGTVPMEHAEAFETKLRCYFLQMGCEYSVHLI